jgi:hypothetical protein
MECSGDAWNPEFAAPPATGSADAHRKSSGGGEEVAHAIHPGFGARVVVVGVFPTRLLEFAQQLLLALGQMTGVSTTTWQSRSPCAWLRTPLMPLPRRRKGFPDWVSAGTRIFRRTVEGRDIDFAAERGGREADRHLAVQIVLFALKDRVRLEVNLDVQVARRPTIDAVLTLAREPNAIALIDSGRNLDRQRLVLLDPTRAVTRRTGVGNEAAGAVTLRAGLLDREETLLQANLTAALTGRAGLRLRTGLGAAAMAGVADLHGRNANLGFGAERPPARG